MGQGVGQGGRADGPQEAFARGGTQAVLAEALGGREDLFLVGTEQEDEQRLRAATRKLGSLNLRGDEPPDGEEIGPVMRVFRQFLDGVLRSSAQPRSNIYRHLSIGPGLYAASLCVLALVARE